MTGFGRPDARSAGGLTARLAVRSQRDRRALRRELQAGLAELAQRGEQVGVRVLDVQLVARVCAGRSYPELQRAHERAWRRQGGRYSTASWPARLAEDEYACVLVPLAAGRVGVAAGQNPKVVASPVFSHGRAPRGGGYEDLVVGLVARWVANPGDGLTARLAPPVIEVLQHGAVVERRLADLGQTWPLPAPDGV
jgi:hypothetical protein